MEVVSQMSGTRNTPMLTSANEFWENLRAERESLVKPGDVHHVHSLRKSVSAKGEAVMIKGPPSREVSGKSGQEGMTPKLTGWSKHHRRFPV
jgi:hypothetical protein